MKPRQLQSRIEALIKEHNVPGITAAVLDSNGDIVEAAAGVTNLNTGIAVDTDTLFQIGSISKVYTTTLIMQLVDSGDLDLDASPAEYLPEFTWPGAESITVRHLLCHISGIEGDYFPFDLGRGDEVVEVYTKNCSDLAKLSEPGEILSYCNSGFVVAGRLVEVLTGQIWDAALRTKLTAPLGLEQTVTLPEEVILHRAAIGHMPNPANPDGGENVLAPIWHLPRAIGPAGIISATARDVLGFAKLHLADGRAPDGTEVLSAASVKLMQEKQTDVPAGVFPGLSGWGLGWMLFDWNGARIIGHDGGTVGQVATLRIAPDHGFALAAICNGFGGGEVEKALTREVFAEIGIEFPSDPVADENHGLDLAAYTGTYERMGVKATVSLKDGALVMDTETSGPMSAMMPGEKDVPLVPVDAERFLTKALRGGPDATATFVDFRDGRPRWLHLGGRAQRRVG